MSLDEDIRKTIIHKEETQQNVKVITYENQLLENEHYVTIRKERQDIYKTTKPGEKIKNEITIHGLLDKNETETLTNKCLNAPPGEYILTSNGTLTDRYIKSVNPLGDDYTDMGD